MKRLLLLSVILMWGLSAATVGQVQGQGQEQGETSYVVQPGDTLFRIAARFGVRMQDIVAANNIVNPNFIVVGQTLVIPGASNPPPAAPPNPGTGVPDQAETGDVYVVQPGDTLFRIAVSHGVTVAALVAANELANPNVIFVGQQLVIPGGTAVPPPAPQAPTAPPAATAPAPSPAPATTSELLPNASFEEGWHFYLYNELQVPDGWQLAVDEGPNTLQPGAGGLFFRPEVRVVPRQDLPESEHDLFVFEGNKTVKAFKGGAPTSFSLFTDVPLQPGRYRLEIAFFPDIVAEYRGGQKVWATDPLFAEMRVIQGAQGTGWQTVQIGQRNVVVYEFTINQAQTLRLGAAFRNRFVAANNGWFLDDWSLIRTE